MFLIHKGDLEKLRYPKILTYRIFFRNDFLFIYIQLVLAAIFLWMLKKQGMNLCNNSAQDIIFFSRAQGVNFHNPLFLYP